MLKIEVPISDTIYAPASATAKAGIAVIRISGPNAKHAIEYLGSAVGQPRFVKMSQCMGFEHLKNAQVSRYSKVKVLFL